MKISINLPEELLKDMDKVCLDEKYERSEFIRTAIRDRIYPKDIHIGTMPVEHKVEINTTPTVAFCDLNMAHPFIKGKEYPVRQITWEDENGNPLINKRWACEKCIKHYQDLGRGRVYFL